MYEEIKINEGDSYQNSSLLRKLWSIQNCAQKPPPSAPSPSPPAPPSPHHHRHHQQLLELFR
jgi:hypothetical protein